MPKNANLNKPSKSDSSETTTSITEKLARLDQSVEWFYGDDFTLDQALEKYQNTAALAKEIETDLAEIKNKVEVLEDFTKS